MDKRISKIIIISLRRIFPVNVAAPRSPDQPFLIILVEHFASGLDALRILRLARGQAENWFLRDSCGPRLAGANPGYVLVREIPFRNSLPWKYRISASVKTVGTGACVRNAERILREICRDAARKIGEKWAFQHWEVWQFSRLLISNFCYFNN